MKAGFSQSGRAQTNGGQWWRSDPIHAMATNDCSICGVTCIEFRDTGADDFDPTNPHACKRCMRKLMTPRNTSEQEIARLRSLVAHAYERHVVAGLKAVDPDCVDCQEIARIGRDVKA